ncbi:xanthine dehydrogenase accessory protein XdhC [Flexivirga sp. ID2601S]|uniref:Xanthine dehydrogenase accessory protein XdhC n=1 Tax=Flexivirga aerilata TaxID=1656889 RepID=A0A849AHI9_9MICO|nr:xanthine dehydrogenase accessory protein XdhC [Flexivirga aerilata]NNG39859.1 xanthine dehydrogenase accessory protein XdhC [Flexivirga aerilata]
MLWTHAIEDAHRRGEPVVLVTVTEVRGHAPQAPGAKLVVSRTASWGTVGGGNLEATAIDRARELLGEPGPAATVSSMHAELNERATTTHGTQCCGGTVDLLLEVLPAPPAVAIFGMGHVGVELTRLLARHPLRLHLIDSRERLLQEARAELRDAPVADLTWHHSPVPEVTLGELPRGCHVLIMTHDHAEDAALCDAALRCGHLATIGMIGSSAKHRRFQQWLRAEGHSDAQIDRIRTPIGDPQIIGKTPAVVAFSVVSELLTHLLTTPVEGRTR